MQTLSLYLCHCTSIHTYMCNLYLCINMYVCVYINIDLTLISLVRDVVPTGVWVFIDDDYFNELLIIRPKGFCFIDDTHTHTAARPRMQHLWQTTHYADTWGIHLINYLVFNTSRADSLYSPQHLAAEDIIYCLKRNLFVKCLF